MEVFTINENFEIVKSQMENLEDANSNPANKLLLSIIPYFGNLIGDGIEILITNSLEKKKDEFLNIILSNKADITLDMVNDVPFILNFIKTLNAVYKLTNNDKIIFFANLIKNGYFVSEKIDCDEFDEYINILSSLSYRQIYILCTLSKHYERSKITSNDKWDKDFFNDVKKRYKDLSEPMIYSILYNLKSNGLVTNLLDNILAFNSNHIFSYVPTEYFSKFERMILGNDTKM